MLCYFKSGISGMKYCLANRMLLEEKEISWALKASETTYSSPIISESVVGYSVMIGVYSVIVYKLFVSM